MPCVPNAAPPRSPCDRIAADGRLRWRRRCVRESEMAEPRRARAERPNETRRLDRAQTTGLTDMEPEAFRAAGHGVVDLIADYLASIEDRPVLPPVEPGSLRPLFDPRPPERPEPIDDILDDYRRLVEPNATHWQHPGFFAYFP